MRTASMVLLHVVAPGEIGGLERVVELLAQGQARAGLDVHVALILDRSEHPFAAALAAGGVTPHPIVLPGRAYRRERAAIAELIRQLKPDVVHTHGARPDVVDSAVARRLDIPTVTTVHGFCGGDWKNRLYERLQRRAYRKVDGVVAVSRPLRARLIRDGVPASRVHVAQNAWQETASLLDPASARRLLGVTQDRFRIGWVGRLSPEKGPDVLINALAHLDDLPISVSVLGDGVERQALLARARRLGVEDTIQWHGIVPGVARLFAAFDVFVLSSRTEGTPIVLFEAMAATVPIVAARVGGVPDVVSPAEGSLVPPGDAAALAAAVRAVYENPAEALSRAQRARERLMTHFTVAPWIRRYEQVYRIVTEQAAPAVVTV